MLEFLPCLTHEYEAVKIYHRQSTYLFTTGIITKAGSFSLTADGAKASTNEVTILISGQVRFNAQLGFYDALSKRCHLPVLRPFLSVAGSDGV